MPKSATETNMVRYKIKIVRNVKKIVWNVKMDIIWTEEIGAKSCLIIVSRLIPMVIVLDARKGLHKTNIKDAKDYQKTVNRLMLKEFA